MMPSRKSNSKPKPDPLPRAVCEWSFEAIGTVWWIGLYEPVQDGRLQAVQQAVTERVERFDRTYSRFRDDSLVTKIAKEAGSFTFPDDGAALFAMYRQLYDVTNGAVTPLIGQLLADAGYDASYSLRPGKLSAPPAWDEVMRYENGTLITELPVLLDFGAAGKGYLVDLVAMELRAAGLERFCVDAGGDMVCFGLSKALQIGLEHPDDPSQITGVTQLQNGALCGSAGNRRAWQNYHHIMNPFTLDSPQSIKAVWVAAGDALTADGLATALFFIDPARLLQQFRFAYAIMYADDTVTMSPNFHAQLFIVTRKKS